MQFESYFMWNLLIPIYSLSNSLNQQKCLYVRQILQSNLVIDKYLYCKAAYHEEQSITRVSGTRLPLQ